MQPNQFSPETLLRPDNVWRLDEGILSVMAEPGSDNPPPEQVVPHDTLRLLHPLLPEALIAAIHGAKKTYFNFSDGESLLGGSCVEYTLRILQNRRLVFTDVAGVMRQAARITMLRNGTTSDSMTMVGMFLETGNTTINGQSVPYYIDIEYLNIEVAKTELSRIFSGWESRMAVAEEMGIEHDDLMSYIFLRAPERTLAAQVDLPDINL